MIISFGSELHSFGAVAENDLLKREVPDLGRQPFVADANCDCEFQMWVLIGLECIQV